MKTKGLIIFLGVGALVVGAYFFIQNTASSREPIVVYQQSIPNPEIYPVISVTGHIRKEKIPEDMDLGDFWYWFYFDTPYLLEQNATGSPQYMQKLQVTTYENQRQDSFDSFLNTSVQLEGYVGWGYAESNIIIAEQITTL